MSRPFHTFSATACMMLIAGLAAGMPSLSAQAQVPGSGATNLFDPSAPLQNTLPPVIGTIRGPGEVTLPPAIPTQPMVRRAPVSPKPAPASVAKRAPVTSPAQTVIKTPPRPAAPSVTVSAPPHVTSPPSPRVSAQPPRVSAQPPHISAPPPGVSAPPPGVSAPPPPGGGTTAPVSTTLAPAAVALPAAKAAPASSGLGIDRLWDHVSGWFGSDKPSPTRPPGPKPVHAPPTPISAPAMATVLAPSAPDPAPTVTAPAPAVAAPAPAQTSPAPDVEIAKPAAPKPVSKPAAAPVVVAKPILPRLKKSPAAPSQAAAAATAAAAMPTSTQPTSTQPTSTQPTSSKPTPPPQAVAQPSAPMAVKIPVPVDAPASVATAVKPSSSVFDTRKLFDLLSGFFQSDERQLAPEAKPATPAKAAKLANLPATTKPANAKPTPAEPILPDTPASGVSVPAPIAPVAAMRSPQKSMAKKDNRRPLFVGLTGQAIRLGTALPKSAQSKDSTCLHRKNQPLSFCIQNVTWPKDMQSAFAINSILYRGTKALVRYDGGVASYVHSLFPTESLGVVRTYLRGLFGPPDRNWTRRIAPLGQPRRDNTATLWQATTGKNGERSFLEIRQFDDSRGGFPDTRFGVLMLYRDGAEPVFPALSELELVPLKMRKTN